MTSEIDSTGTLIVRSSLNKTVVLMLFCLALAIFFTCSLLGVLPVRNPGDHAETAWNYAGLAFCGGMFVVSAWGMYRLSDPIIVISPDGIRALATAASGTIPWKKVEDVWVGVRPGGPGMFGAKPVFIRLDPSFERELFQGHSAMHLAYRLAQGIEINTAGLDLDGDTIAARCRDYLKKSKEPPNV